MLLSFHVQGCIIASDGSLCYLVWDSGNGRPMPRTDLFFVCSYYHHCSHLLGVDRNSW